MKIDLCPFLMEERKDLMDRLKRDKTFEFVQEDIFLLREKDLRFSVEFQGVKLLYYQFNGRLVSTPWHRLLVSQTRASIDNPQVALSRVLEILQLRYFRDEDSHGAGVFRGVADSGCEFAYCYVNPDFKNGHWENHTLEVKPALFPENPGGSPRELRAGPWSFQRVGETEDGEGIYRNKHTKELSVEKDYQYLVPAAQQEMDGEIVKSNIFC